VQSQRYTGAPLHSWDLDLSHSLPRFTSLLLGITEVGIYHLEEGFAYLQSSDMSLTPEVVHDLVKVMKWFETRSGDQPLSPVEANGKQMMFITGEPETVYYRGQGKQLIAAKSPRSVVVGMCSSSVVAPVARYLLFTMTQRLRESGF
jgi:Profilin